jgi:hypothetical protein
MEPEDGFNGRLSIRTSEQGGLMMTDQSAIVKLDQARKLMDQGQHRESLLLALEVLLQELNNLRESLIALQMMTRLELETPAPPAREEPPEPDFFWLPAVKTRVLH